MIGGGAAAASPFGYLSMMVVRRRPPVLVASLADTTPVSRHKGTPAATQAPGVRAPPVPSREPTRDRHARAVGWARVRASRSGWLSGPVYLCAAHKVLPDRICHGPGSKDGGVLGYLSEDFD